ncbi:MAG: hypothetical protein H6642_09175 [Caldilineaceae bacterium]|nr:hypothetical protein [Caldilineaceae bacterium]
MRFLRFLALAAALAAAYFAQYIFDHGSLADFFPDRLLRTIPALAQYTLWLPDDLLMLALALGLVAALGFGLLIPPWRGALDVRRMPLRRPIQPSQWVLLACGLGVALAAGVGVTLWITGRESLPLMVIWAIGLLLFVAGLWHATRNTPSDYDAAPTQRIFTPGLIAVLLAAGLLFIWQLADLPRAIDQGLAAFSVEALRGSQDARFFLPGGQGLPRAAYLASSVFMQVGRNILVETRLPGPPAGLAVMLFTWLTARILFQRVPKHDERIDGEAGYSVAGLPAGLLAAMTGFLLLTIPAMLHFARLPFYLEPVAWGMAELWLWLYAAKKSDLFTAGLSGMAAGMAMTLSPTGMTFVIIGLLWWVGTVLFDSIWAGRNTRLQGFLFWLGGWWLFFAPLAGTWLNAPSRWTSYVRAPALLDGAPFLPDATLFTLNFRRTLFAFNQTADLSTVFGYPDSLLPSLLAPLLLLAVGALLLNIDTWLGWMLSMWLITGVLMAAWLGTQAPFAPVMLPLLPAVAVSIVFALDRVRAALTASVGTWIEQAALLLISGLLLWASVHNWSYYYNFAAREGDVAGEMARIVHDSDGVSAVVLVNDPAAPPLDWRDAPLLLAQTDLPRAVVRGVVTPPDWPAAPAPGTRFLFPPAARHLIVEATTRYPNSVVSLRRDIRGNPVGYWVDVQ